MPLVATDFTPEQQQFLRNAADLINPGMTDQEVVDWINQRAMALIAEDVKARIVAGLREDHNSAIRTWESDYTSAFGNTG